MPIAIVGPIVACSDASLVSELMICVWRIRRPNRTSTPANTAGEADRHQRAPAMPVREHDRQRVQQGERGSSATARAPSPPCRRSGRLQLIGLEDRQLRDVWWQLRGDVRPAARAETRCCRGSHARLSVTTPLLTPTAPFPPLTMAMNGWSAARLACAHSCWTRGRAERELGALYGDVAQRPGGGCGQACSCVAARLDEPGDVVIRIQLIDEIVGGGGSTFESWSNWVLVFDQLSGLNRRRLAHVANMPTIRSRVVTPIRISPRSAAGARSSPARLPTSTRRKASRPCPVPR